MTNTKKDLQGGGRIFEVLPPLARTATPAGGEFSGGKDTGLIVVIDATAVTATGSVTVLVEGVDRVSGKSWTILQSAAIVATGTTVLRIHPELTAATNLVAKDALPPVFRITCTHANAVSVTYSVSGHFVD